MALCGEIGGRPLEAMTLIALGFRDLSMSATSIGPIKAMILSLPLAEVRAEVDALVEQRRRSRLVARAVARDRRALRRPASDANMNLDGHLDTILRRHEELGHKLSASPSGAEYAEISREYAELEPLAEAIRVLRAKEKERADLEAMLADPALDAEMRLDRCGRDGGGAHGERRDDPQNPPRLAAQGRR